MYIIKEKKIIAALSREIMNEIQMNNYKSPQAG